MGLARTSPMACLLALSLWSQDARGDQVPDFKLTAGPYFAAFSNGYGVWGGLHARCWLLDVTGERGYSGYLELVDLHWRPDGKGAITAPADAEFVVGRVLKYWGDHVYTFATVAGTLGDPVFPRLQGEAELNFIVPQHPTLVLAFGGGYRHYPAVDRPYIIVGASYSFPFAAMLYRYYSGAGLAWARSDTHLLTWTFGQRLKAWLRVDLLWGNEEFSVNAVPRLFADVVRSKGVYVTWEQWILPNLGIATAASLSEGVVEIEQTINMHRWQIEIRPFFTF